MKNNKILNKYELLDKNPDNFSQTIFIEDEQNAIFEFNILNTCEFDFPGNGRTRLIADTIKSQIELKDIIIENEKGLKYGEKDSKFDYVKKVIEKATKNMYGHELQFEDALKYQGPMRKHIAGNPHREHGEP